MRSCAHSTIYAIWNALWRWLASISQACKTTRTRSNVQNTARSTSSKLQQQESDLTHLWLKFIYSNTFLRFTLKYVRIVAIIRYFVILYAFLLVFIVILVFTKFYVNVNGFLWAWQTGVLLGCSGWVSNALIDTFVHFYIFNETFECVFDNQFLIGQNLLENLWIACELIKLLSEKLYLCGSFNLNSMEVNIFECYRNLLFCGIYQELRRKWRMQFCIF